MLSFYARVFFTYTPLLGLKGFLGLFFIVRYGHIVEMWWLAGKVQVMDGSGGHAGPWGCLRGWLGRVTGWCCN